MFVLIKDHLGQHIPNGASTEFINVWQRSTGGPVSLTPPGRWLSLWLSFGSRFPGEQARGLQATGRSSAGPHQLQTSWHHLLRLPQPRGRTDSGCPHACRWPRRARQSQSQTAAGLGERKSVTWHTNITERKKKKKEKSVLALCEILMLMGFTLETPKVPCSRGS